MRLRISGWHRIARSVAASVLLTPLANAQPADPPIVYDGTLGVGQLGESPPNIGGGGPPSYLIEEQFGETVGNNLFLSFLLFGVPEGETATIAGSSAIDAIFARVTGDGPTKIDGLLRSAIPNADLLVLNPNGILTGPGAEIDVGGSLTLSTADYVTFADAGGVVTGVFHATVPGQTLLSMDAPWAFGFMDSDVAPIEVDGTVLDVSYRPDSNGDNLNSLSLVGGDVRITGGAVVGAKGGDVNLVSVASAGEVIFGFGIDVSSFEALGDIELLDGSSVVSSGLLPSEPALVGGCCNVSFGLTPPALPPGSIEIGRYQNGPLHSSSVWSPHRSRRRPATSPSARTT